jgi:putative ATP-binding cassette transporter
VQYLLNFWNRDFFNAIGRRDGTGLWIEAWRFLPLAAASLALAVASVWGRMTMQRSWREWLSNHLYDYWLGHDRNIRLKQISGDYQPEYRIAEDGRVATDLPVDLALGLLTSFLTLLTFIGILWSVGDGLTFELFGTTFNIHGYLVIAVVLYSIVVAGAMLLIGRPLTRIMEKNKQTEAQLRSIGTHLGETDEHSHPDQPNLQRDGRDLIGRSLQRVINVWRAYCLQLVRMTLVSHTNFVLTPVIGLLLCTPKYLAGAMTLGEVVQAAAAFVIVQGAFNWFTDSYARLAEWTASAHRVASLLLALDQVDRAEPTTPEKLR